MKSNSNKNQKNKKRLVIETLSDIKKKNNLKKEKKSE